MSNSSVVGKGAVKLQARALTLDVDRCPLGVDYRGRIEARGMKYAYKVKRT
jgi:hypothetical protein